MIYLRPAATPDWRGPSADFNPSHHAIKPLLSLITLAPSIVRIHYRGTLAYVSRLQFKTD